MTSSRPTCPASAATLPPGFDSTKEAYLDWLIGEVESVGEPVDIVGHDWGALLVERLVSVQAGPGAHVGGGRGRD